jgi:hypothetical protein
MGACVKIVFAVASLMSITAVWSADHGIVCPTEISESSINLLGISQPWTPYVASPLYLSSAGATAGPPDHRATLMGDSTWKKGSTEWSTTYDLNGGFVAGKWMECRYGEYGQVLLSTRLDDKTKSCTVRFSKGEKAGQRTVKISCN